MKLCMTVLYIFYIIFQHIFNTTGMSHLIFGLFMLSPCAVFVTSRQASKSASNQTNKPNQSKPNKTNPTQRKPNQTNPTQPKPTQPNPTQPNLTQPNQPTNQPTNQLNYSQTRHTATFIWRPRKFVNRNFLLYNIWIYPHPRYKATNCGEETVSIYRVFTVLLLLTL